MKRLPRGVAPEAAVQEATELPQELARLRGLLIDVHRVHREDRVELRNGLVHVLRPKPLA